MKLLINRVNYSEKFICLTNALQNLQGITVGSSANQLNEEAVLSFKPDIVIHNSLESVPLYEKFKVIQIFVSDQKVDVDTPYTIDLSEIGPCIDLSLFNNVKTYDKYKCDMVFFGDISVFDQELLKYLTPEHSLRIFNGPILSCLHYCGNLPRHMFASAYHSAFCCPFSIKEDRSRLHEIVKAGGLPVIYDPVDPNTFHNEIDRVLYDAKKGARVPYKAIVSKEELEASYNTNKMRNVLKKLGLNKLANLIG
jgi:hypothetical protein